MRISFVLQSILILLTACLSKAEERGEFKGKFRFLGNSDSGRSDENRTRADFHRKKRPPSEEQMELLRFLLEASPERLQVIRGTIERVEKMTPEERKSMRARLKRFRENAPAARTKMMKDFHMRQDLLRRYWKTLDPETEAREIKHFHQLPMPERHKYLEKIRKKQKASEGKKAKSKEAVPD
ncbi:MAG: hypothetical protein HN531_11705 [Opitutae bacterium]|jgi:hypothetical protein|nr:hypothetical protein [Opitutae bacterium]